MKTFSFNPSSVFFLIFAFLGMFPLGTSALAQTPRDVPHPKDSEPIAFDNLTTIITFIVLPVFFVALYLWLKRRKRRKE